MWKLGLDWSILTATQVVDVEAGFGLVNSDTNTAKVCLQPMHMIMIKNKQLLGLANACYKQKLFIFVDVSAHINLVGII